MGAANRFLGLLSGSGGKTDARWLVDPDSDSIFYMSQNTELIDGSCAYNGHNQRVWLSRSFQKPIKLKGDEVFVQFHKKGKGRFRSRYFEANEKTYTFLKLVRGVIRDNDRYAASLTTRGLSGKKQTWNVKGGIARRNLDTFLSTYMVYEGGIVERVHVTVPAKPRGVSVAEGDDEKEQEEAQAVFNRIDTDQSGEISKAEFLEAFQNKKRAGQIFAAADRDGDGSLTIEEFRKADVAGTIRREGLELNVRRRMAQREFSSRRDSPVTNNPVIARRRMAQREFSSRRDSPVMTR